MKPNRILNKEIECNAELTTLNLQKSELLTTLTVENSLAVYRKISIIQRKIDYIIKQQKKKQKSNKYYFLKDNV